MIQRFALVLSFVLPTAILAQPVNDLCTAVTPEALNIGVSLTFSGTRVGATTTNDGVAGNVLMTTAGVASVWHAFTTTACSDVTVLYCNTPLPATTQWNFLTSCPGDARVGFSYADFGGFCTNGQFGIKWVNLPAGTYYLPIYCTANSGAYEIEASAVACTPGPTNDNCAGATTIPVNTTCLPVNGTVEHGTMSMQNNECNGATGSANDDVWFNFTAIGAVHTITVDGNGDFDAVIELYDGNCANTTPIVCADATLDGGIESITMSDLIAANSYAVRVFHYYTSLALDPTFTICVTGDIGTTVTEQNAPQLRIVPNPAHDLITISQGNNGSVRILDLTGRTVWSERSTERATIDVSAWPRGWYIFQMDSDKGSLTERIILH
ncbi:MAG: T9SS type A sorting domain-containing protein [Flavobacteriales bacterium]|jgi:hypothetical protein